MIFLLPALQELNLTLNLFTKIPSSIEKLQNLKRPNIGSSGLVFPLPAEIAETKIEHFEYGGPRVDHEKRPTPGEHSPLFEMKMLRTLHLDRWEMGDLSPSIQKLTALKTLVLDFNALTTLPDEMQALTSLEHLVLTNNAFEKFPEVLFKMSFLKSLVIEHRLFAKAKRRFTKAQPQCVVKSSNY